MSLGPSRLSAKAARLVVRLAKQPLLLGLITADIRRELGVEAMRRLPASARDPVDLSPRPIAGRQRHERGSDELPPLAAPAFGHTSERYGAAYRDGLSPRTVVDRFERENERLAERAQPMSPMEFVDRERARAEAEASAARHAAGRPLGPLDGVLVPVKEEVDLEGHGNRAGLATPAPTDAVDATLVTRLRRNGAIVIGTTMMTELGMTPLGFSSARKLPRNAHDLGRSAAGSSTGTAVAVATNLCPAGIGTDGGGSIRIPAAWNGIFGIKPTFGRISRRGVATRGTMSQGGPLALSTLDLARVLEAVSGADPDDELTRDNPGFTRGWLEAATRRGVRGLRIGILEGELEAASPATERACRDALDALVREGATLVPVSLPLARFIRAIGFVSIGIEALAELTPLRQGAAFEQLGLPLQSFSRFLSGFAPDDHLDAQAFRARLRRDLAALFRDVDAIACPTVVRGSYRITDAELYEGFVDVSLLNDTSRFAYLANLTGVPAASAPVGRDEDGQPIGLQILTDAWDEATALQILAHLERLGVAQTARPALPVDLLAEAP